MLTYRIFTNDRARKNGRPMYSALKDVKATTPEQALKQCPPQFTAPNVSPAVAIQWPAGESDKDWLDKFVGAKA